MAKAEIERVLSGQAMVLPDRYPQDVETRLDAVGKNMDGRYIFVVFTLKEERGQARLAPILPLC